MLDKELEERLIHSITADRQRMQELAEAQPRYMHNVTEYQSLWARVVETERQLQTVRRAQRAVVLDVGRIRWDRRTGDVLVLSERWNIGDMYLAFAFSETARDDVNKMAIARFSRIAHVRQTRTSVESLLDYPLGIVGLDGLGAFVVEDSLLMRECGIDSDSDLRHYCFTFADGCVECVAAACNVTVCLRSDACRVLGSVLEQHWAALKQ
jgi:hypothetical protein